MSAFKLATYRRGGGAYFEPLTEQHVSEEREKKGSLPDIIESSVWSYSSEASAHGRSLAVTQPAFRLCTKKKLGHDGNMRDFPRHGMMHQVILSAAAKELIENQGLGKNLEFARLKLLSARNSPMDEVYYMAHACPLLSGCFDGSKMEGAERASSPGTYQYVTRFAILEGKIPEGVGLFRVKEASGCFFFRSELAEAITAAGLTGLSFQDYDDEIPMMEDDGFVPNG